MNLSNNLNGQLTFLDLLNVLSFVIGLENLNANLTQNDKADLQKELADKTSDIIKQINAHLEQQDIRLKEQERKLNEILAKLEELNNK